MKILKMLVCAVFALVATVLACSASAAEVGTVVADSGLRLRSGASSSSNTITVVESGAQLVITELGESWSKVNYAGTEGYMATEYLAHEPTAMFATRLSGKITASVVNLRAEPSTEAERVGQLVENTRVEIIGCESGWFHVNADGLEGYVHPDYVFALSAYLPSRAAAIAAWSGVISDERAELIAYAQQYVGTKYTYGGRSPSTGFDCSGFVYYVFNEFGYTLNPGASTQMDSVSVITKGELIPGDLVFFNNGSARRASHVGIYIGDGKFVHAVSPGKSLAVTNLSDSYYSRYFVGGGRVLPVE